LYDYEYKSMGVSSGYTEVCSRYNYFYCYYVFMLMLITIAAVAVSRIFPGPLLICMPHPKMCYAFFPPGFFRLYVYTFRIYSKFATATTSMGNVKILWLQMRCLFFPKKGWGVGKSSFSSNVKCDKSHHVVWANRS